MSMVLSCFITSFHDILCICSLQENMWVVDSFSLYQMGHVGSVLLMFLFGNLCYSIRSGVLLFGFVERG